MWQFIEQFLTSPNSLTFLGNHLISREYIHVSFEMTPQYNRNGMLMATFKNVKLLDLRNFMLRHVRLHSSSPLNFAQVILSSQIDSQICVSEPICIICIYIYIFQFYVSARHFLKGIQSQYIYLYIYNMYVCAGLVISTIKRNKYFMYLYFNALQHQCYSATEPLQIVGSRFTIDFPGVPATQLMDLGRMKG